MKLKSMSWLLIGVLGCSSTPRSDEESILVFEEWTLDSDRKSLDADGSFVDINSTLKVSVDGEKLREELLKRFDHARISQDILSSLRVALDELGEALPGMREAYEKVAAGADGAKLLQLQAIGRASVAIEAILSSLPAELGSVRTIYDARLATALQAEPGLITSFTVFADVVSAALADLKVSEVERLQDQGVVVRFGAWRTSDGEVIPVHLAGFDDYQPGEFVEYERVAISLTQDQKQQLEEIVERSKQINAEGGGIDFGNLTRRLVDELDQALDGELSALRLVFEGIRDDIASMDQDARSQIEESVGKLRNRLGSSERLIRRLLAKYRSIGRSPGSLAVLADVREDVRTLRDEIGLLVSLLTKEVEQVLSVLESASESLREHAQALEARITGLAEGFQMLTGGAQMNLAILEFGEEVLALDVADVPANTALDLRRTGAREPGDQIAFVMKAGRANTPVERHQEVDARQFSIFRILGHVTSTVSLSFVNPTESTELQTDFQAAPTYSLLYKWGANDSAFHNRFLRPGIGLSLSALDFDGDDRLELGVGAAVSLFHDWIQGGYGYNVGTDDGYWYVGFSLPILDRVWNDTE